MPKFRCLVSMAIQFLISPVVGYRRRPETDVKDLVGNEVRLIGVKHVTITVTCGSLSFGLSFQLCIDPFLEDLKWLCRTVIVRKRKEMRREAQLAGQQLLLYYRG